MGMQGGAQSDGEADDSGDGDGNGVNSNPEFFSYSSVTDQLQSKRESSMCICREMRSLMGRPMTVVTGTGSTPTLSCGGRTSAA